MSQDDMKRLEIALSHLLSFDVEDCHDILEHLLSFESKDDLLEHMISLLGDSNTKEIHSFVDNVMRYLNGETLTLEDTLTIDDKNEEDKKMPAQPSQVSVEKHLPTQTLEKQRIEQEKKDRQRALEAERRKQLEEEEAIRLKMAQIRIEQEEALMALKKNADELNHNNMKETLSETSSNTFNDSIMDETKVVDPKKIEKTASKSKDAPKIPLQGKAKIVCGCFGTVHKPLTNCLYCGRISCEKEGYGYCSFCSNLIDVPPKNKSSDTATLHKERLLKFDRDAARRTIIYDDQADYYSNSTSTWLSEDEQQSAKAKEDERQKELHSVKKHVMNLQF